MTFGLANLMEPKKLPRARDNCLLKAQPLLEVESLLNYSKGCSDNFSISKARTVSTMDMPKPSSWLLYTICGISIDATLISIIIIDSQGIVVRDCVQRGSCSTA